MNLNQYCLENNELEQRFTTQVKEASLAYQAELDKIRHGTEKVKASLDAGQLWVNTDSDPYAPECGMDAMDHALSLRKAAYKVFQQALLTATDARKNARQELDNRWVNATLRKI